MKKYLSLFLIGLMFALPTTLFAKSPPIRSAVLASEVLSKGAQYYQSLYYGYTDIIIVEQTANLFHFKVTYRNPNAGKPYIARCTDWFCGEVLGTGWWAAYSSLSLAVFTAQTGSAHMEYDPANGDGDADCQRACPGGAALTGIQPARWEEHTILINDITGMDMSEYGTKLGTLLRDKHGELVLSFAYGKGIQIIYHIPAD